ncbi:hypothetical protein ACLOJK_014684 [Asimina triloba]
MLMEPDVMICWTFRWGSWLLLPWSIVAGRDVVRVVVLGRPLLLDRTGHDEDGCYSGCRWGDAAQGV